MRLTSTLALIGLPVALATSCVGWTPLPKAGVPLRTEPTSEWPSSLLFSSAEPAPVAINSIEVPPREPEANVAEASAPESASPTNSRRLPSAQLRSRQVLDGVVLTSTGKHYGRVQDVLLEPESGAVVGVLVARTLSDNDPVQTVLQLKALSFSSEGSEPPVIALREAQTESSLNSLDYSDLVESYGLTDIGGDIVDVAALESDPSGAIILKIRDESNLLHRVLIEPGVLVMHFADDWKAGGSVRVNGVLTRDKVGKLLVANSVTRNGEVLQLRDEAGSVLWDELAIPFQSARGLKDHAIVTSDGTEHAVTNWLLNRKLGRVSHLCLNVRGKARILKWDAVQRDGSTWSVTLDQASLAKLPLFARKNDLDESR